MGKYDLRKNYRLMLNRLRVEYGEPKTDTTQYSDYNLLLEINKYLAKLHCQTYTQHDLNVLASDLH